MIAKQDKKPGAVSWIFKGEGFVSLSLFYAGSKETELKIEGDPSKHFYLQIESKLHFFPTAKVLH